MKPVFWGISLTFCGCLLAIGCGQQSQRAGDAPNTTVKADDSKDKTSAPSSNGHNDSDVDDPASDADVELTTVTPGPDAYKTAQEALAYAEPGDVIEFAEGEFEFSRPLSLDGKDNITIRGQGMDKTKLIFSGQQKGTGAEGVSVKAANDFTIEDLTLQDTLGDAIKINGAKGVTVRGVKTWWSNGPDEKNGAYGIYPVLCENVLIEKCIAECASDAGIYVGQSRNIIVRHNRAEQNVAGIEIENCIGADVYENEATNNTGGLLVFSLPGLELKNGRDCRVYNNHIYNNNHDNFAAPGNMVATVPPGTGLSVMANDRVEVFDNNIHDHKSTNCYIISFFTTQREFKDTAYDPYPEAIAIYNNKFANGGYDPQKGWATVTAYLPEKRLPDIVYDGIIDEQKLVDGKLPADKQLYIGENGEFTFANIDFGKLLAGEKPEPSFDLEPYSAQLPQLTAISIPGVK